MKNILKTVRQAIAETTYTGGNAIIPLEALHAIKCAILDYDEQLAKHAERRKIKMLKCVGLKARTEDGARRDVILEPGDMAAVIGYTKVGLIVETTDPAHVHFAVPFDDEKITWEYTL